MKDPYLEFTRLPDAAVVKQYTDKGVSILLATSLAAFRKLAALYASDTTKGWLRVTFSFNVLPMYPSFKGRGWDLGSGLEQTFEFKETPHFWDKVFNWLKPKKDALLVKAVTLVLKACYKLLEGLFLQRYYKPDHHNSSFNVLVFVKTIYEAIQEEQKQAVTLWPEGSEQRATATDYSNRFFYKTPASHSKRIHAYELSLQSDKGKPVDKQYWELLTTGDELPLVLLRAVDIGPGAPKTRTRKVHHLIKAASTLFNLVSFKVRAIKILTASASDPLDFMQLFFMVMQHKYSGPAPALIPQPVSTTVPSSIISPSLPMEPLENLRDTPLGPALDRLNQLDIRQALSPPRLVPDPELSDPFSIDPATLDFAALEPVPLGTTERLPMELDTLELEPLLLEPLPLEPLPLHPVQLAPVELDPVVLEPQELDKRDLVITEANSYLEFVRLPDAAVVKQYTDVGVSPSLASALASLRKLSALYASATSQLFPVAQFAFDMLIMYPTFIGVDWPLSSGLVHTLQLFKGPDFWISIFKWLQPGSYSINLEAVVSLLRECYRLLEGFFPQTHYRPDRVGLGQVLVKTIYEAIQQEQTSAATLWPEGSAERSTAIYYSTKLFYRPVGYTNRVIHPYQLSLWSEKGKAMKDPWQHSDIVMTLPLIRLTAVSVDPRVYQTKGRKAHLPLKEASSAFNLVSLKPKIINVSTAIGSTPVDLIHLFSLLLREKSLVATPVPDPLPTVPTPVPGPLPTVPTLTTTPSLPIASLEELLDLPLDPALDMLNQLETGQSLNLLPPRLEVGPEPVDPLSIDPFSMDPATLDFAALEPLQIEPQELKRTTDDVDELADFFFPDAKRLRDK